jgi:hypothetical protein
MILNTLNQSVLDLDFITSVHNGHIHHGKQNHQRQDCGRQFVENNRKKYIFNSLKKWIDNLLVERISWSGIGRVFEVSGT